MLSPLSHNSSSASVRSPSTVGRVQRGIIAHRGVDMVLEMFFPDHRFARRNVAEDQRSVSGPALSHTNTNRRREIRPLGGYSLDISTAFLEVWHHHLARQCVEQPTLRFWTTS